MNWLAIVQLLMEFISRLRAREAELNAQGQSLGIPWERLVKYVPQLLELLIAIFKDLAGGSPGDLPGPNNVDFENPETKEKYCAAVADAASRAFGDAGGESDAQFKWREIAELLLPIFLEWLNRRNMAVNPESTSKTY